MNIVYLADARSAHTQKWARHFAEAGHRVTVLSMRSGAIPGVAVEALRETQPPRALYFALAGRARRIIARLQPDILHAHYATSYGLLGALAGWKPLIVSVWGSDILEFPNKLPLHRALVRFALARATRVFSTSAAMAEPARRLMPAGAPPLALTPFGVDTEVFAPARPPAPDSGGVWFPRNRGLGGGPGGEIVVGALGSLRPEKGMEYLLRAFARAKERRPGVPLRLEIMGDGPLRGELEALAETLGIAASTAFLGAVSGEEVPKRLRGFDIYAGVSVRESFGVATLEAQACGVPVVVSNVGGMPETIAEGETGLLTPPRDVEAIADALGRLADDAELRRRMGAAAREFVVRNYEWRDTAQNMERLYAEILASEAQRPASAVA